MHTDTELLRIELDTLWAIDARGRLLHVRGDPSRSAPTFVIGTAGDEWISASRFDVADDAAASLSAFAAKMPPSPDRSFPDAARLRCQELLDTIPGAFVVGVGLGFLLPDDVAFDSGADIVTSDATPAIRKSLRTPGEARWQPDEWASLIDGRLGPWAMAVIDDAVVSICHCARLTAVAAEAGVWTHPDFRGQRHAAAVTAAWAPLLRPRLRHIFYSTSAENTASRRVAARLSAREIGWIWHFDRAATA